MLDTYVLTQLDMWSRWRARRLDNGLGYPKKSNFVQLPGGGFWTPEMDSACIAVDQAICALIDERQLVVITYYTYRGTQEQQAKHCGCSINTFKNRFNLATKDILGFLNDLAAGIPIKNNELSKNTKESEINYTEAA